MASALSRTLGGSGAWLAFLRGWLDPAWPRHSATAPRSSVTGAKLEVVRLKTRNRSFLHSAAATLQRRCLAVFLFIQRGPHCVAQSWFGTPRIGQLPGSSVKDYVNWPLFDMPTRRRACSRRATALGHATAALDFAFRPSAHASTKPRPPRCAIFWIYLGALCSLGTVSWACWFSQPLSEGLF